MPENINGKNGNGSAKKKRNMHPNSLANLRDDANRMPRRKPKSFFEHLKYALKETPLDRDGHPILIDGKEMSAEQAMVKLMVRRALFHMQPGKEWDKSCDHILARVCPIPKDYEITERQSITAVQVKSDDRAIQVAFVQKVRETAGGQNVTSDDVLNALDLEADNLSEYQP